MSVDFAEAADRHWRDAELLWRHQRWPNADQLYGLAAECGLKAVMQGFGMPVRQDGAPQDEKHRVHIDKLWSEFGTFSSGAGNAQYAALLPQSNPFDNWSVHHRYWSTGSISQGDVELHRRGASQVRQVLGRALVDGSI